MSSSLIARLNSLFVLTTQFHDVRQEHVVLSLCVHLSCYTHQVALIQREFALCLQTNYELQSH